MTLLDLDPARAQAVADAHGGGKASAAEIDARSVDDLAAAIGDAGVLVNTASYRVNLEAMRACLQAGCNYLDLGGLYWMTGRQRELGADFERAGLLAVLGIGSSPGKTNLMAARGVRELGAAQFETIDVMAAGRDPAAPADGRMRPPYAIQTLLDELTLAPVVLRDGQPVEIDPLSPGGSVSYGDPIGTAETIFTLHSELATFGESFGCRGSSFRLSLAGPLLERLKAARRRIRGRGGGRRARGGLAVKRDGVGASGRAAHHRRPVADRARDQPTALRARRFGCLHGRAGGRHGAAVRARIADRDRCAAAGALHRARRDVRRARDPELQLQPRVGVSAARHSSCRPCRPRRASRRPRRRSRTPGRCRARSRGRRAGSPRMLPTRSP